jgi:hypothetical protein
MYGGNSRRSIMDLLHVSLEIRGPVNIDNIWRIRNNLEIDELIESADKVRFMKAQRIK